MLRALWLGLAFWGAVHPMYYFVTYLMANGWDPMALIDAWFVNDSTRGLTWDLIISATVLTIWILAETAVRRNWQALLAIPATFCIGVSCGFPLYLWFRSRRID
jgi:hypothetical protein